MLAIVVSTTDNRPLASTLITPECLVNNCTSPAKSAVSVYVLEPDAYSANVYYSNNILYIKSVSIYDKAMLIAF